jgi:acyl-CoA thioester hydrolase
VIAETTLRFKAPTFFDHTLHGAATVPWIGNRSYAMDFELRNGGSFRGGELACEGFAAHVFFDPEKGEVQPRPDWFLPTVAALEGRLEDDFAPPER